MRIMIKIFAVLVLVIFWSGPAAGIDKSKKNERPKDQKTVQVEKKKPEQTTSPQDSQGAQSKKTTKNYDDFIDRNNNGIDDRAEKSNTKQTQDKPAPEATPKKNPKP